MDSTKKLKLRDYQQEAVDKMLWARKLEGNDVVVSPTASGKSIIVAEFAYRLNEPLLILQPSKEILEQNFKKLLMYVDQDEIGIYSASKNSKEIRRFTFATIQSIYKVPELFSNFNTCLIDEGHGLDPKSASSMYQKFFKAAGIEKVYGLTATPYRLTPSYFKNGDQLEASVAIKMITRTSPKFWKRIIHNTPHHELVEKGYLCPLKYVNLDIIRQEELKLNASLTGFDEEDVENKVQSKKEKILETVSICSKHHKHILVFVSSLKLAEELSNCIGDADFVTGTMNHKLREEKMNNFFSGKVKILFNVKVVSVGVDFPALDCIVNVKPMRSLAEYQQLAGRGCRIFPGKTHCTFVDLTNTVKTLGEIESVKLVKNEKNLWDVETSTGTWHNKQLYSYVVPKKDSNK